MHRVLRPGSQPGGGVEPARPLRPPAGRHPTGSWPRCRATPLRVPRARGAVPRGRRRRAHGASMPDVALRHAVEPAHRRRRRGRCGWPRSASSPPWPTPSASGSWSRCAPRRRRYPAAALAALHGRDLHLPPRRLNRARRHEPEWSRRRSRRAWRRVTGVPSACAVATPGAAVGPPHRRQSHRRRVDVGLRPRCHRAGPPACPALRGLRRRQPDRLPSRGDLQRAVDQDREPAP